MTYLDQRPRVRLGAGIWVLSPDGKLLIVQQEFDGRRTWGSLGGGLEYGESIEECAVREAHEESGLHVRLVRLLWVDQFWRAGEFEHVGFVFLATPEPWPQTVVLPERDGDTLFLAHRWIDRDEVESIPVTEREPRDRLYDTWPPDIETVTIRRLEVAVGERY